MIASRLIEPNSGDQKREGKKIVVLFFEVSDT